MCCFVLFYDVLLYVYVYVYGCMLSLRRAIASVCAVGVINNMVGDNQRVEDRGQSCTAGYSRSRTIRVARHTIRMQVRYDSFLPDH